MWISKFLLLWDLKANRTSGGNDVRKEEFKKGSTKCVDLLVLLFLDIAASPTLTGSGTWNVMDDGCIDDDSMDFLSLLFLLYEASVAMLMLK